MSESVLVSLTYIQMSTDTLLHYLIARKILEQILNAVYYWHQKGIIHRDLKLENVLFSDIETLEIKVVDFGIAGYIRNNIGEDTDFGTVRYMAPEVLSNKDKKASRAIDIWAWGVILYTMLWNKFPFSGKNKCKLDFLLLLHLMIWISRFMNNFW